VIGLLPLKLYKWQLDQSPSITVGNYVRIASLLVILIATDVGASYHFISSALMVFASSQQVSLI